MTAGAASSGGATVLVIETRLVPTFPDDLRRYLEGRPLDQVVSKRLAYPVVA